MLPVPDASVPAVDICSERSAAGITFSAKDTLRKRQYFYVVCTSGRLFHDTVVAITSEGPHKGDTDL